MVVGSLWTHWICLWLAHVTWRMEQNCKPVLIILAVTAALTNLLSNRCESSLRSHYGDFADSLLGIPFLRSVFTVFDYVDWDMESVSPRLGLASLLDGKLAMERYRS